MDIPPNAPEETPEIERSAAEPNQDQQAETTDSIDETAQTAAPERARWIDTLVWLASFLGVILAAALAVWFIRPLRYDVIGPPTATPQPPTSTPLPTNTPEPTATATQTPLPTPTAYPASSYLVPDGDAIYPALPGAIDAVILNDDRALTPVPDFANPQWSSSDIIASQLGFTPPSDGFHATYGNGSATWQMDVPLAPGFYEVHVLDTLNSSYGRLNFTLSLDGSPLMPVLGQPMVDYWSSQFEPVQTSDLWHSIGIYFIDRDGILAVNTTWQNLEGLEVVAVDRVALTRLPDSVYALLSELPRDRRTYIIDDAAAKIETNSTLVDENSTLAWGDRYQVMINPGTDAKATWTFQDPIPAGTVEVLVRIPEVNGDAQAAFRLIAGGTELQPTSGASPIQAIPAESSGKWLSLGTWDVPLGLGTRVMISVEMQGLDAGSGDLVVDALALMVAPTLE
ncbi:MAG: hypothetical protein HPY76_07890 [Anaerolineae bacterium]|nr:hypothetical protein [Anaerolineae bacterium]